MTAGDLNIFIHTLDFDFGQVIGGIEIPSVPFGRTVQVQPSGDSEPLVFFLSPTSTGEKRISVEFIQSR